MVAQDTKDNEDARRALLRARRHLQEAIVALQFAQFAGFPAPDLREDLQAQCERLVQIVDALTDHAHRRFPRATPPPTNTPSQNS